MTIKNNLHYKDAGSGSRKKKSCNTEPVGGGGTWRASNSQSGKQTGEGIPGNNPFTPTPRNMRQKMDKTHRGNKAQCYGHRRA